VGSELRIPESPPGRIRKSTRLEPHIPMVGGIGAGGKRLSSVPTRTRVSSTLTGISASRLWWRDCSMSLVVLRRRCLKNSLNLFILFVFLEKIFGDLFIASGSRNIEPRHGVHPCLRAIPRLTLPVRPLMFSKPRRPNSLPKQALVSGSRALFSHQVL